MQVPSLNLQILIQWICGGTQYYAYLISTPGNYEIRISGIAFKQLSGEAETFFLILFVPEGF